MKVSSFGPFGQSPPAAQLLAKPFVSAMSFARMDTFARGEISGMMKAGMTRARTRAHARAHSRSLARFEKGKTHQRWRTHTLRWTYMGNGVCKDSA